jgi:hypothetical protein
MTKLVVFLAFAAAGCAGNAGDLMLKGAPWQCAMLPKGALTPDLALQVNMQLAKDGSVATAVTSRIRAPDGLHESEMQLDGAWKRIENAVQLAMRSPRLTQLALNGQAVTRERLDQENAKLAGMMTSYVPGSMTIAELSESKLKLESDVVWLDCRSAGAP